MLVILQWAPKSEVCLDAEFQSHLVLLWSAKGIDSLTYICNSVCVS